MSALCILLLHTIIPIDCVLCVSMHIICYNWLVAILTICSRDVSLAIERNRLTFPAILVRTLFCPKGTDMAMHAANTMEAVPRFKAV